MSNAPPVSLRSVWIISDGKAGHESQSRGVAAALGSEPVVKFIAPRRTWRVLAPWGPVDPAERFGQPGSTFAPPWPDVAIATGRATVPYLRRLKRVAGAGVFTVALQDPRTGCGAADLVWVPDHDKLRGANVINTPTSPHAFSPERLAALRAQCPPEIAALPGPRVAVLLGGNSKVFRFSADDAARLGRALAALAEKGASFLVTGSRRTPPDVVAAVDQATAAAPRVFYRGEGDNPYAQFLAHADALVVTGDSVSMTGEACATGRPVLVFMPSGGSDKFKRFHAALAAVGATAALSETPADVPRGQRVPLFSSRIIADEILTRLARRRGMLA